MKPAPAKSFQLVIKVKPYVSKYLTAQLGADYQLCRMDPYGLHLVNLMRRPRQKAWAAAVQEQYRATFTVGINKGQWFDDGAHHLPARSAHDFNCYVEREFFWRQNMYIEMARSLGLEIEQAITEFNRLYAITPNDISIETQLSNYKRFQKKRRNSPGNLNRAKNG